MLSIIMYVFRHTLKYVLLTVPSAVTLAQLTISLYAMCSSSRAGFLPFLTRCSTVSKSPFPCLSFPNLESRMKKPALLEGTTWIQ